MRSLKVSNGIAPGRYRLKRHLQSIYVIGNVNLPEALEHLAQGIDSLDPSQVFRFHVIAPFDTGAKGKRQPILRRFPTTLPTVSEDYPVELLPARQLSFGQVSKLLRCFQYLQRCGCVGAANLPTLNALRELDKRHRSIISGGPTAVEMPNELYVSVPVHHCRRVEALHCEGEVPSLQPSRSPVVFLSLAILSRIDPDPIWYPIGECRS